MHLGRATRHDLNGRGTVAAHIDVVRIPGRVSGPRSGNGGHTTLLRIWPNYYWTVTPSSATRCRHPTVDASIFTWMALFARPRASPIGCGFADNAAVQAERDHATVVQLPDPLF